jgi:hypothetical protein
MPNFRSPQLPRRALHAVTGRVQYANAAPPAALHMPPFLLRRLLSSRRLVMMPMSKPSTHSPRLSLCALLAATGHAQHARVTPPVASHMPTRLPSSLHPPALLCTRSAAPTWPLHRLLLRLLVLLSPAPPRRAGCLASNDSGRDTEEALLLPRATVLLVPSDLLRQRLTPPQNS